MEIYVKVLELFSAEFIINQYFRPNYVRCHRQTTAKIRLSFVVVEVSYGNQPRACAPN